MSAHKLKRRYSDQAQSELRNILLYTETTWNAGQRTAYEQHLRATINTPALTPGLGRKRDELSVGLRSYPSGSHVLYYRETEGALVIARIMHSRQDPFREEWEQSSPIE